MKKHIIYCLNLVSIILVLLIFPLALVILLITGERGIFEEVNTYTKILIIIQFPWFFLAGILIKKIFKIAYFTKALKNLDSHRTKRIKKRSKWKKECIKGLIINKELYKGITKRYCLVRRWPGIVFIILLVAIIIWIPNIIPLVLPFILVFLYLYLFRNIKISPEGIEYKDLLKKYFLDWSSIETVGVSISNDRGDTPIAWIYLSNKTIKTRKYVNRKMLSDGFIVVKFRSKLMHHILCNWQNEVVNIESMRSWRKYLKKYGE